MIQNNSVSQSVSTALVLAEKGFTVNPKPNTILENLVRITNDQLISSELIGVYGDNDQFQRNSNVLDTSELEAFGSIMETLTNGTIDSPSKHDAALTELGHTLCKSILNHISFAKNVVKPLAVDYAEKVIAYLESFTPPEASSQFNIRVLDMPKPLEDVGFQDLISVYKDRSAIIPSNSIQLGQKTEEELMSLLMTRDSVVDQGIVEWLTTKNEPAFLTTIWNSFFLDSKENIISTNYITYEQINKLDVFAKADYYLAIFLLANKLFTEVDATSTGMSLPDYKNLVAETRNYSGVSLVQAYSFVKNYDVLKTIVIRVDEDRKEADVYGINYRDWLSAGGNIETVFGLIVSGIKANTRPMIDKMSAELASSWNRYVILTNTTNKSKTLEYFKNALNIFFTELMNELTEEEMEFVNQTSGYKDKVKEYLDEQISEVNPTSMNDVYITCLKVICRARFYYTDAEKILLDINELAAANPGSDIREIAFLSICNYIADYCSDMMVLTVD